MTYRPVLFAVVAAMAAVASVPMAGQAPRGADSAAAASLPRTAWGDPDLQGIWRNFVRQLPFERPAEFEGREFRTEAEISALTRFNDEFAEKQRSGTAERRGFRSLQIYDSRFGYNEDPVRISRRTSAIIDPPDGRLPPWTAEQIKHYEARLAATRGRGWADTWEDRPPAERCIKVVTAPHVTLWGLGYGDQDRTSQLQTAGGQTGVQGSRADVVDQSGISRNASGPSVTRILQAPGYVVMVMEEAGDYAIIPLDGRPALGPTFRHWGGEPRGRWDGNTLVVEITNIRYEGPLITTYGVRQYPGSGETLRVIERYTRLDADTLEYRYTIDDPKVYTRPYTALHELSRDDQYKISPHLCHENNRDMGGVLANARADEADALQPAVTAMREREARLEELKRERLERLEELNKRR